ncbi:MAG: putative in family peptidase, partial [Chloroflexi bacterium]|nr:putative in family peptidase [Chloroflexota bacterium]
MAHRRRGVASRLARLLILVPVLLFLTNLQATSSSGIASAGAAQGGPLQGLVHQRPQVDASQLDNNGNIPAAVLPASLTKRTGTVQVILELSAPPAVVAYAAAGGRGALVQANAALQTQAARIDATQRSLLGPLASAGARIIYRVQRVYNGIAMNVDASRLPQLQHLPGVKAVHFLVPKTIGNSNSIPFIGAPQLWNPSGLNATGQGIKLGIIDTGIDYLHTDFGGPGTPAAYAANNSTSAPVPGFPGPRVAGGTDLAGDAYNGSNVPQPDPNPFDCNGHGSHVAGISAGSGINADGTTYAGPYNSALPFSSFKIMPGVAPQASIYSIRVFGCNGSTNLVAPALDWAVANHLDVVNMSLGSSFGPADDPDAVASDNAVLAGTIVVAAAGNSSSTYYNTGSPGSSRRALSVASSVDDSPAPALQVLSPASIAGTYQAGSAAFGPALSTPGVSGTLVYASPNNACLPLTNAAAIAGNVALIDRGACVFANKVKAAQNAGAVAVVIVNNVPGPPAGMAGSDPTITIPSEMVSQSDGATLKANLGAPVVVSISSANTFTGGADTLSSFSSRGPDAGGSGLKPDITAPGDTITSVLAGSGNGSVAESGTSMASPHVAGSLALLRQLHPTWSIEDLKALAMNTATHDVRSASPPAAPIYGLARVGAGRIDLPNAGADSVVAFSADDPGQVSVSFGVPEVVGTATLTRTVRVENKGASSASYAVSYVPVVSVPGVSYSVPTSLTLAANEAQTLQVTLNATAAQMTHTHDVTVPVTQNGLPRAWISEAAGYLVLTPTSGPTLRVPVYAVPRPASAMAAASNTLTFSSPADTKSIGLAGQGVNTLGIAANPVGELSLVATLELQQTLVADPSVTGLDRTAELKAVGVTSNVKATTGIADPNSELYFGVATYAPWTTPNSVEYDVYISTNGHTSPDYILFSTNYAQLTGATDASDTFVTALYNLHTGHVTIEDFVDGIDPGTLDTVPYNTNAMVLPVSTAHLGLAPGSSQISYQILSYGRYGQVSQTSALHYDPATPGLDFTAGSILNNGGALAADQPGSALPVTFNQTSYNAAGSQGALLLHLHNGLGSQDEIVGVNVAASLSVAAASGTYGGTTTLQATLLDDNSNPVPNRTITFHLNGASFSGNTATTNSSGVATLTG